MKYISRRIAKLPRQDGMTIVELIAVLVISGIMAAGVFGYIGRAVEGISTASNRNQLATAGRIALDRLAMELHNALPNSIRVEPTTPVGSGEQCIEFIPVRAATTYIDPPFTGPGSTTFDVVNFYEGGVVSQQGSTGGFAVIYPNRQSEFYDGDNGSSATWPSFSSPGPIQEIDNIAASASPDQSTVTLTTSHRFNRRSPSERFFLADQPVSFCIKSGKLYRYSNYGFFAAQSDTEEEAGVCVTTNDDACLPNYSSAPDKMLITDSIDNTGVTAFNVGTQTLTRNSLVSIQLNFSDGSDSVLLSHEILSRSVP